MRKSITFKTLFRSPLKTLLTFLLMAAASFALFSRVTDYAVTTRETKNAESLYHAVASLNNEVEDITIEIKSVQSPNGWVMDGYGTVYEMEDKPWPTEEELEEFISLPGVTLADTRYLTAGLIGDSRNLTGDGDFLFEGTYNGYIDDKEDEYVLEDHVRLKFDDIKVVAGDEWLATGSSVTMHAVPLGEMYYARSPFTRAFYDSLEKGSRCLVYASRPGWVGPAEEDTYFQFEEGKEALCVIDGLPEDYLETEAFARQKGWAEAIDYNLHAYSVLYTLDMRAMHRLNEQRLKIAQGRLLTAKDAGSDVCVVSKEFLKAHGLSIGDSVSIQLGDKLCHWISVGEGNELPGFGESVKLSIVGVYTDESGEVDTIFVPSTLLPVEVPDDYEVKQDEFSVFVEDARDIESFHEAAEQFAQKMDLDLEYSDRGWLDVKDSFGMGAFTSLLTTVLYIVGAVLALFLAVYLYIGRNKKSYAIMRMLGVPGRAAGNLVLLPFVAIAVSAVPIGGITGLYYAQRQAAGTLARMADSTPVGYVPDATLPVGIIILCLFLEWIFIWFSAYFFLRKMKAAPPLELLHEGVKHRAMVGMVPNNLDDSTSAAVPSGLDTAKLSIVEKSLPRGNYGSIRHVAAYIWRHMRRATGKTVVSLVLAVVLAAGIGMLVLAGLTYEDAFYELGVKGTAKDFIFTYATELSRSSLVKDFYCYDNFGVRVEGVEDDIPMTITSDLARDMGDNCVVDYAEGYDITSFEGTAQICLVGKDIAEKYGISPGDEIGMLSDFLYTMLKEQNEEAASAGYKTYKVIGVVQSQDVNVRGSIFTGIRNDLTRLFSIDFPVEHCEFTLADNDRLDELELLLERMQGLSTSYSSYVSYHVDSGGLANIERIRGLLESLFPIAVAAAVLIGLFGPLLVILQSAQEAAFLRILGVTKKRARCMLMFEQVILCIAGVVLVAGGIALYNPGRFARGIETFATCYGLYLLGCVCGAFAAAIQVTRHRILELLQVKE